MEKVVSKLSEIEAAAVAIMDNATTQKKQLSSEMDERIKQFDAEVDAKTAKSLTDLKNRLETETNMELAQLKSDTLKTLEELEKDFEKNHSKIAKSLLDSIV